jgi:hypothetical protein
MVRWYGVTTKSTKDHPADIAWTRIAKFGSTAFPMFISFEIAMDFQRVCMCRSILLASDDWLEVCGKKG